MKVKCELKNVLVTVTDKLMKSDSGNYFFFIPSVGVIRARKTTQISWQIYGIGLPKKALLERINAIPNAQVSFNLEAGDYTLEMIDSLYCNVTDLDAPEEKEKESEGKKDKKKMKGEVEKAGKKHLDAVYKKKQIFNALTNAAIYKKKEIKGIVSLIEFDGKKATGQDVLDGIDSFFSKAPTKGAVDAIFAELS